MSDDFDFDEELDNNNENQTGRKEITLNEHQKHKIKETLKKMEDNLVKPQTTVGRVFVGAGFASNPERIIFKDFEVGVPMQMTTELTNISYGFNSFKLLPLNDEIIDFIEIDYRPCGRIPAGISTQMTLKFTPIVEKDLISSLNLLSETGMVEIPLECLAKKCDVKIANATIDFGEVILGNQVERQLNIENTGALACLYAFLDDEKNFFYYSSENENKKPAENAEIKLYEEFIERSLIVEKNSFLNDLENIKTYFLKQVSYNSKGSLDGYSKKTINFTLDSRFIGEYALKLYFKIEYKKNIEYRPLLIKFTVVDLPVYSEKKTYNLDYLIEDHIFREKLILYNTSNIPYKVQIYNPKEINEFIELNPNLGYIQANSSFEIWIKLKINKKIRSLPKFYKGNKDSKDEFNFPLKIVIHKINVPLVVILNFFVTSDTIEFNKLFINFEKTFTDEANKISLSLQNKSLLPQKYGFIMLPKELSVKNNIDTVLSDEKMNVEVVYESQDNYLGHREGDIFCKVITNDLTVQNIKLKFHVELMKPDILIKPKHILFPVLPERERANLIISLKNTSHEDFVCEWLTPPASLSGLIIMPKVFEIKSGSVITCIIEYNSNFRPYGPFSFEEIQQEILNLFGFDAVNILNSEIKPDVKTELKNPLMEDKLKRELEAILTGSTGANEKDKKKSAEQKPKKEDKKGLEVKKDKKQLEEEERKAKELLDIKLAEEEEKKANRIQNFDREKELKMFGCQRHSFDGEDAKSEHSRIIIPLYYKPVVKEDRETVKNAYSNRNNINIGSSNNNSNIGNNQLETSPEVYNFEGANATDGFKANNTNPNNNIDNSSNADKNHSQAIAQAPNSNRAESGSSTNANAINKRPANLPQNNMKLTFIEVSTTTIEKDLIFDKEEIDFGEVSVKTRKTINVTLTNRSSKAAVLKMKPLIVSNCFQVINAVRDVPPGGVFNFLIDFYPLKDLPYFDEFTVFTGETQSTIKLKGIGVQPEIEIIGVENSVLFLGNSMGFNYLEKAFEIQNKSNFAIDYEVKVLRSGKKNKNGYKPFTYVPYRGSIPAGGRIPVKISFFGDHQDFLNFWELILVDVPNQKKPNKIFVQAACWSRQLFWRESVTPVFPEDSFFLSNTEQDFFSDPLRISKLNNTNMNPNNNERILLEFVKYAGENLSKEELERTTKRKITIGNCKMNDPKNEKAGAFEIIMAKDDMYFSIDNPKGTVNAGSEVTLTFTLKKPGRDTLLRDLSCLNDIGMWVTTKAELKLVGGFVNSGAADAVSVEVLLRAYIEQI